MISKNILYSLHFPTSWKKIDPYTSQKQSMSASKTVREIDEVPPFLHNRQDESFEGTQNLCFLLQMPENL